MAALQFADLLKELKGTTIPRWTVLVKKIKTKDTFVIDKTTQEVKLNYLDKNIQGLFEQGKITDIQTTYRGQELFKATILLCKPFSYFCGLVSMTIVSA